MYKPYRPYLDLHVRFGARHTKGYRFTQIFPGLNEEIGSIENIVERFRTNTIFDIDLDLLAGINYQINDRLLIGIEAHLSRVLLPAPRALQVRHRLGNARKEQSR